jgi:gluconokinase
MGGNEVSKSLVVMGVSGSGKSTIGRLLAEENRYKFQDSDDLHSPENKARMASGIALTDRDRMPWLESIGKLLEDEGNSDENIVVACSALKRSYRDILRSFSPDLFFVHLVGSKHVIETRMASRHHEFMSSALLESQFSLLEPLQSDERGISIEISKNPHDIVLEIAQTLNHVTN